MRLFDLHADIGYDIIQKKKQKITKDVITNYHVEKFHKGEIAFICMASFFDGKETWDEMKDMISSTRKEIDACDVVDLVLTREDLEKDTGNVKAIMSVEGMCGIHDEPREKIRWMYAQGVRLASLCWNDENDLATGVMGNLEHGLHPLGREVVEEMISLNMIIDVSHTNEKTFWDIMSYKDAHVIATHSNIRDVCNHPRNLWKQQAEAILDRGGLIGMNSAPTFISEHVEERDCEHLVNHVKWIKDFRGNVDGIACGFDFMDFYDEYHGYCKGLKDCTQAQNFVKELELHKFKKEEIQAIAYENAVAYFNRYL